MRYKYKKEEDKLAIIYPNYKDVLNDFHIDFQEGVVYSKKFWDKKIRRRIGRSTTNGEYTRVNINTPNHKHIWSRGNVDCMAHRLIHYAYDGTLCEIIDHKYKNFEKMKEKLGNLVEKAKTLDTIHNLRASDSLKNRMNQSKIKKIRETSKSKHSKEYVGVVERYGFYWVYHKKEYLNEQGFIHPYLAVDFRNKYILEKYGDCVEETIQEIDQEDLQLFKVAQEAVEKTQFYKTKHLEIMAEFEKRKEERSQNKIKKQGFVDYFEGI